MKTQKTAKYIITTIIIIFVMASATYSTEGRYNITVNVKNIQNDGGTLIISLWNTSDKFLENGKELQIIKKNVTTRESTIVIENIQLGEYSISIIQDMNGNNVMDKNLVGYPTESYGFSNNATGFMGPPSYRETRFFVKKDIVLFISMK